MNGDDSTVFVVPYFVPNFTDLSTEPLCNVTPFLGGHHPFKVRNDSILELWTTKRKGTHSSVNLHGQSFFGRQFQVHYHICLRICTVANDHLRQPKSAWGKKNEFDRCLPLLAQIQHTNAQSFLTILFRLFISDRVGVVLIKRNILLHWATKMRLNYRGYTAISTA